MTKLVEALPKMKRYAVGMYLESLSHFMIPHLLVIRGGAEVAAARAIMHDPPEERRCTSLERSGQQGDGHVS